MKVTVVGCSGSFAGPNSPSSSYLVQHREEGRVWNVVLDLGSGALGALQRHCDLDDIDAVFLSHLHPDHCVDMCGLYVARRYRPEGPVQTPLSVWGPAGTEERLSAMYHGLEAGGMGSQFTIKTLTSAAPVQVGPLTITPVAVNHPVEAYGFRVEADEVVLAYTGDTDDCDALVPLLRDADLALMDCAFVDGRDDGVTGIHLSGSRAAAAAVRAGGVDHLVLTHLPAWNDADVCRAQAATRWHGQLSVAAAGDVYALEPRRM